MDKVVPWARLEVLIEPHYPRSGREGRQPIGLSRMLRIYCSQQRYTLVDEMLEDTFYDSHAMREVVSIDFGRNSVRDATTLLNFRHLLERHKPTRVILNEVNQHLAEKGLLMRQGTVAGATIIDAPVQPGTSKASETPRCTKPRRAASARRRS